MTMAKEKKQEMTENVEKSEFVAIDNIAPDDLTPEESFKTEVADSIQEHIISEVPKDTPAYDLPEDAPISPAGERFDARLHVSPDSITKSGKYRKKKNAETPEEIKQENLENTEAELIGKIAAQTYPQVLSLIIDADCTPDKTERETLEIAFANYCKSKNIKDIPPGVALCLVLTSFSYKKIQQNDKTERVKNMIKKPFAFLGKIFKRKSKKINNEGTKE